MSFAGGARGLRAEADKSRAAKSPALVLKVRPFAPAMLPGRRPDCFWRVEEWQEYCHPGGVSSCAWWGNTAALTGEQFDPPRPAVHADTLAVLQARERFLD